jgi:glycosyltransferase involved in cell wall biosynthesis
VHGTNFVVPSATAPRLVSVYDLSFVHDPGAASSNVRRFDAAIRAAVARGAHVHTTSHAVAGEISSHYGVKAHVIVPGVVPPAALPAGSASSASDTPSTILAIGTATRRKNFPLLVEAFGRVAAVVPDVRLVIAGSPGDDSERLRAAVASAAPAVRSRIELRGRVDSVVDLYRSATVLAHPSRYEGVGLPVLEAMTHGVPVVAARAAAVEEVAGDAAVLVGVDDAVALSDGLISILVDRHKAEAHAAMGRTRAGLFSWAESVRQLTELYRRLANP